MKAAAPAGVSVRATSEGDWRHLKALRLAALLDAPAAFGVSHAEAAAYTDDAWRSRAGGAGPARYFLAWQGEQAVGMVAAVATPGPGLGLIAMWVDPAWRGRRPRAAGGTAAPAAGSAAPAASLAESAASVADLLIAAVKAYAVASGAAVLTLEVAPGNARAVALYARHGFSFQSHLEQLASHPDIVVQRMAWAMPAPAGAAVAAACRA